MLDKMNNNSTIPPPHLFKIYGAPTVSRRQNYTSMYNFYYQVSTKLKHRGSLKDIRGFTQQRCF